MTGAPPGGEQAIADLARRALSFELVGVVREMVAIAVDHATERHQFGRPIGSFQAVQHRLAEAKVALEAADQAAQRSLHSDDALVATMAKLLAGRPAAWPVGNVNRCSAVWVSPGSTDCTATSDAR